MLRRSIGFAPSGKARMASTPAEGPKARWRSARCSAASVRRTAAASIGLESATPQRPASDQTIRPTRLTLSESAILIVSPTTTIGAVETSNTPSLEMFSTRQIPAPDSCSTRAIRQMLRWRSVIRRSGKTASGTPSNRGSPSEWEGSGWSILSSSSELEVRSQDTLSSRCSSQRIAQIKAGCRVGDPSPIRHFRTAYLGGRDRVTSAPPRSKFENYRDRHPMLIIVGRREIGVSISIAVVAFQAKLAV